MTGGTRRWTSAASEAGVWYNGAMTRTLAVLVVLLSACAAPSVHGPAFQQAAPARAPMRPPAARPVVNSPHFPAPGATPAGAGAYRGEPLPSASVPRSPNKRVLPASAEPGLWAADGALVALIQRRREESTRLVLRWHEENPRPRAVTVDMT